MGATKRSGQRCHRQKEDVIEKRPSSSSRMTVPEGGACSARYKYLAWFCLLRVVKQEEDCNRNRSCNVAFLSLDSELAMDVLDIE